MAVTKSRYFCLEFPCQPYSSMGNEGGFQDERADPLGEAIRIIFALEPIMVALECAAGFLVRREGIHRNSLRAALQIVM